MTYATTFSGLGGWELGLNACGWKLKWQCERDAWCQRLLNKRFGVPVAPDIETAIEWLHEQFGYSPSIDALIGSPPCQPWSQVGEMRGSADARNLYKPFVRIVRHFQPRWVLMEQVPNILSIEQGKAFGGYIGGLAEIGYDVLWHSIPASAIGADHERERIWIIAHANGNGMPGLIQGGNLEAYGQGGASCQEDLQPTNWRDRPLLGCPRESILCRKDDGIADWSHRIRAIGNAVVPQIPFLIGQAINSVEGN